MLRDGFVHSTMPTMDNALTDLIVRNDVRVGLQLSRPVPASHHVCGGAGHGLPWAQFREEMDFPMVGEVRKKDLSSDRRGFAWQSPMSSHIKQKKHKSGIL